MFWTEKEKENKSDKNLWDATKIMFTSKCTPSNVYVRKDLKSVGFNFGKRVRKIWKRKIREEMMELKRNWENHDKDWFFEKVNKNDKLLTRWTKKN